MRYVDYFLTELQREEFIEKLLKNLEAKLIRYSY